MGCGDHVVSQLVLLKLSAGSLETGFSVTLQIGEEAARPTIELTAALPPAPELWQAYQHWQGIYTRLDLRGRPIGLPKNSQPASITDCQLAAKTCEQIFNQWLQSESFRPVREKWLEKLQITDGIRVILQTPDPQVEKLPWHLWDLLQRYPQAEIAFSAPRYEQATKTLSTRKTVRILAILGDSSGIDTQADRRLLEALPNAQVKFLVEPRREELTSQLWQQPWDIFFFAGHSATGAVGNPGYMAINPQETIALSDLKSTLRQAVSKGLQLAIFNSCDGLGLAHQFAELEIPQLIVMREPVPDRVAQSFLKSFLQAYAQNQPLYAAVRSAKEQLEGLENQFPCATWLPVIVQNPADRPYTWQELLGRTSSGAFFKPLSLMQRGVTALIAVGLTAATLGLRHSGQLQSAELALYDQALRARPQEPPDDRLLIITVTEEDVKAQADRSTSLSDESLAKLLNKLDAAKPRAIGLDIYRDFPVKNAANNPLLKQLSQGLKENDRLITTCRVVDPVQKIAEITPPPESPQSQWGFSNFMLDPDQTSRRQILLVQPPANAKCAAPESLSMLLALRYLADMDLNPIANEQNHWTWGKAKFTSLQSHDGGYQGIDAWGHQVLLNYRNYRSPAAIAPQVTLAEALSPNWNATIAQDKIVLIGTTAESFKDISTTPYQTEKGDRLTIPGVVMQAQMISQLVSAAIDDRPLIQTWAWQVDGLWVLFWSAVGGLWAWVRRRRNWGIGLGLLTVTIVGVGSAGLMFAAVWVPIVPPLLAMLATSAIVFYGLPCITSGGRQ
jgi:CHASE2 domain-containing sensor protein